MTRRAALRTLWGFLAANFILSAGLAGIYVLSTQGLGGWASLAFVVLAGLSVFMTLYLLLFALFATAVLLLPHRRTLLAFILPLMLVFQAVIFVDAAIYRIFRFHINGMVINLLVTEGSWDSVKIGAVSFLYFGLGLAAVVIAEALLLEGLRRRFAGRGDRPGVARLLLGTLAVCLAVIVADKLTFAAADLLGRTSVTRNEKVFPLYFPLTARDFMARRFGFKTDQDLARGAGEGPRTLNYPRAKMACRPLERYPNVVFVVVDAWRYDMLDPEVTPGLWAFSRRSLNFRNHYSAGNGSRFGGFSLVYGLWGSYWHQFLAERQGPVLIDELKKLGYDFKVIASTRLTMPEFRKTSFVRIPEAIEDELGGEGADVRDPRLAERFAAWLTGERDRSRPFFAFLWLNAPHGPYAYPDAYEKFRPSNKTANYVTVGRKDMEALRNSYRNALFFDDDIVGRILAGLEADGRLEDTIILVTGDHGEEFQESGYFGHTSSFDDWQTKVPMLLHLPGRAPAAIDYLTSHLDVAPTLLSLLGCATPFEAYSQGGDLLDGRGRPYVVCSGWNDLAIVDAEHVIVFSTETYNLSRFEVRDRRYAPAAEPRRVLASRRAVVGEVLAGMSRFLK